MRRPLAYAAGILAVLPWITPAAPASLTNRDIRERTVTILEKSQASVSRALKPEESLEGICRKGCIIRLDGNERDEYIVEGNERLSIEPTGVFLDGLEPQEAPASSSPGERTPPQRP